jgi:hypothetical protein
MATYKDLLIESLPTAAWMLESSSSVEKDITLSGLDATVAVADRVGAPLVGGAAASFTFNSPGDRINYPNMNIWSEGNHGVSFSIEFVVRPISSLEEVTIFAPVNQGQVIPENKISILNNKLSFVVSDYLSGSYTERFETYTFLDFSGGTYHCVAVYTPDAIYLYVNNELMHTARVSGRFKWRHSASSYSTVGSTTASVVVSSMAVYKGILDPKEIASHYRALFYRESPSSVAIAKKGCAFTLNDADRQKGFYFNAPLLSAWTNATLDNVDIVNGRLTLETIQPAEINTGTATFSNSHLALSTSQFVKIAGVEERLGSGEGSIGLNVKYTSARHGALSSGEYFILSLFNENKQCRIEVLEKSDKKIYVRYTSNGIASADALLASPSTGSDSDNYLYIEFESTQVYAFWNSASTSVTIPTTSDGGGSPPRFENGSSLNIGADSDGTGIWGSHFWWVNLWEQKAYSDNLDFIKTQVYQYTLKLATNLNVSQLGTAYWVLDTGVEGPETIDQSRIWWAPSINPNMLKIQAGVTSATDLPIFVEGPAAADISYESGYKSTYGGIVGQTTYSSSYETSYGAAEVGLIVQDNMFEVPEIAVGDLIPETIYVRAILSTDDSVNNITYLKKIGVDLITETDVISETGQSELIFGSTPRIEFSSENISSQELYHGAKIFSPSSACKIYSPYTTDPLADDTNLPEFATSVPPTGLEIAKTVEVYARIPTDTSGILFKYKGSNSHVLSYSNTTRAFTVTGFDKLYIDGENVPLTAGVSGAMPVFFENKWHMINLVKENLVSYSSTPASVGADIYLGSYQGVYSGSESSGGGGLPPIVGGGSGSTTMPTFVAAGAVATGTTSLSVPYPAGIASNDLLVLAITNKYYPDPPFPFPTDWDYQNSVAGGTGAPGVDTGNTYTHVFTKVASGSESGSLSQSMPSSNTSIARMLAYRGGVGETWSVSIPAGAAETTQNTSWSPTFGATDLDLVPNSKCIAVSGINSNEGTWSAQSLSATNSPSVTFGTMVERSDSGSANGDDIALVITEHPVSSGTNATPSITYSMTGTASGGGTTLVFSIRSSSAGSGGATLTLDASRFYTAVKSLKFVTGASAASIELATESEAINKTSGGKNSISFMVYPDAGITSIKTNFKYNGTDSKVTHTVIPESWNLVTRTFTNPSTITTMSVMIETSAGSQTVWLDDLSLVSGGDPFIRFADTDSGSSWFGKDVDSPGTTQLQFDLQNVLTYKQSLNEESIYDNYRTYTGNRVAILTPAGSGQNTVPATGTSVSDPTEIINRNPDTGDTLFESNPVFLSNEWRVLSVN